MRKSDITRFLHAVHTASDRKLGGACVRQNASDGKLGGACVLQATESWAGPGNEAITRSMLASWGVGSRLPRWYCPSVSVNFIAYVYKYNRTYRVTLTANPTRETKHQIGMTLR